jgi:ATP-binding cassette subfamily B protein
MKKTLGIPNYFENSQASLQTVPAIQKLFEEIGAEATLISKLNTVCEMCEFHLGDEITKYKTPDNTNNLVEKEQSDRNFYLVCEGRVRLLAVEASQQQEISAVVLEVGAIFGTENLFIESGLPYRQLRRVLAKSLELRPQNCSLF